MSYFIVSNISDLDFVSYLGVADKLVPYKKQNGRRVPIVIQVPFISTMSIEKDENKLKITKEKIKQYTYHTEEHTKFINLIENLQDVQSFDHSQFILGNGLKIKGDVSTINDIFSENNHFNLKMFVVVREIKYQKVILEVRHIEAIGEVVNMNIEIDEDSDGETDGETDFEADGESEIERNENESSIQEYSFKDDEIEDSETQISLNDKRTTIKNLYMETLEKAKKAQELAQIYFNECERLREMYYELGS